MLLEKRFTSTPKRLILITGASTVIGLLLAFGLVVASVGPSTAKQLISELSDIGTRTVFAIVPESMLPGPTMEEYEVYEAVVKAFTRSRRSNTYDPTPMSVALRNSLPDQFHGRIATRKAFAECFDRYSLNFDAVSDLLLKSQEQSVLRPKLDLPMPYLLVENQRAAEALSWPSSHFPILVTPVNRYITFSRVGFDVSRSQAIVYVEDHCSLCGFGGLFLGANLESCG